MAKDTSILQDINFLLLDYLTGLIINDINPVIEKYTSKNELEGMILYEFMFIIKQLRIYVGICKTALVHDEVDAAIIIISLFRSVIENVAKVGYFFIDKKDTEKMNQKIQAWKDYTFMEVAWHNNIQKNNIELDDYKLFDSFEKYCKKELDNSGPWGKINKELNETSKLIKLVLGESFYKEWKECSKFLHANTFYRRIYLIQNEGNTAFNIQYFGIECSVLSLMLFQSILGNDDFNWLGLLPEIVCIIDNDSLRCCYRELLEKILYYQTLLIQHTRKL